MLLSSCGGSSAPPAGGWLSYGGDPQLTNQVPGIDGGRPAFRQLWRTRLNGGLIAGPLASTDVVVGGKRRDAVFAATEHGHVYALDAATGRTLWTRSFGTFDTKACSVFGVSSTPALDPRTGRLYVIGWDGLVRALDSATGGDAAGWRPVRVISNTRIEHVWAGLRIVGDRLYVGVASYCDQRDALGRPGDGRIVAIDTRENRIAATLDTVPGPHNLGGVWGWGGVSVEPDGSYLYATVGNACPKPNPDAPDACIDEDAGHGNSILRLTPDLRVVDSNTPANVPSLGDSDFGATPLLFDPPGCPPLASAVNKNGHLYIWRRHELGRGPIFDAEIAKGNVFFVGEPSYSDRLRMLFLTGANPPGSKKGNGVAGIEVQDGCRFTIRWRTAVGLAPYAPPLVVGDAIAFGLGEAKGFALLDARTGKLLQSAPATLKTFAPLSSAGGRIFGADFNGYVYAFTI